MPDAFDGQVTALLEASGGEVLIDDLIFRHDELAGETAFNRLLVEELRQLRPGFLRYLQMGGSTVENMLQPPVRQFRFSSSPWMRTGPHGGPFRYPFSPA